MPKKSPSHIVCPNRLFLVSPHQIARLVVPLHQLGSGPQRVAVSYGGSVVPASGSWRWEGLVVTGAFVSCVIGAVLGVDDTLGAPPFAGYVIAAVSSVSLLGRRRAPVTTLAVTTLCGMFVAPAGLLTTPLAVAPAVVSAYSIAAGSERRAAFAVVAACAALLVVVPPFVEDDLVWEDVSRLVTVAAAPLVAAVLGRSSRHRRAYLALMEERARVAEESRETQAHHRVAEERVRIARELHDLVAHQITLANAQASVAAHVFDTQPDKARASLNELVETTRHALDELRATVGLLRRRGDTPAATEPAPGLARLGVLTESFRHAGLDASVQVEGTAQTLPPGSDLAAYRVIQEALTNVTKHASTATAQVRLVWDDEHLTITIADDGEPNPFLSDRPPGYGLIGLRERLSVIGGDLTAGPQAGRGFLVTATVPLGPSPVSADHVATGSGTTSVGNVP